MPQLVTRIDDDLAAQIDRLIASGDVQSRSDAVRSGLRVLLEEKRRKDVAQAIIKGYLDQPQIAQDIGWSDRATAEMIAEEPW